MKTKLSLALLLALPGLLCSCAQKPAQSPPPAVCPIMGDPVRTITPTTPRSVYAGRTYYFCCAPCKSVFDRNPAKYAAPGSHRHWWLH